MTFILAYRAERLVYCARMENKDLLLVKTNTPHVGDLPQTDLMLPFNEVQAHLDRLPDKNAGIVVYCSAGGRSSSTAQELVEAGYTNVMWLDGGIPAWERAGHGIFGRRDAPIQKRNVMSVSRPITRRAMLRLAGGASLALLTGGLPGMLSACAPTPAAQDPGSALDSLPPEPDIEIALRAAPSEAQILPGKMTQVWSYRGEVLQGDPSSVQHLPGSYLGPVFRLRRGQRVRIRFYNELPEPSIVHWHGLHVPEAADGHPRLAIQPGESYTYDFTVANRAGTYWYHPHPHGRTGSQVMMGLAGLLLVTDEQEQAAGLPTGESDVPLVIQDRTLDADHQLLYMGRGMMDQIMGFLGDRILVNGQPNYVLTAAARPHRLRLLNGCNARTLKLGWEDGTPLTVIGTDGGLLRSPVERPYVVLGPAERVELWADFAGREVGSEVRLMSLPFAGGEVGMMGQGMMDGSPLPEGSSFEVLRVRVDRSSDEHPFLPDVLSEPGFWPVEQATNRRQPRAFSLSMSRMQWMLNGRTFEMEDVARDETVRLGDTEVWEFANRGPGMSMIHPMHIHNLQFQVLSREVQPAFRTVWETLSEGFVDEGWKDTVLVMPGEQVRLLLRFEDYAGLYLYHCHILEHEDLGMMRNYRVQA